MCMHPVTYLAYEKHPVAKKAHLDTYSSFRNCSFLSGTLPNINTQNYVEYLSKTLQLRLKAKTELLVKTAMLLFGLALVSLTFTRSHERLLSRDPMNAF